MVADIRRTAGHESERRHVFHLAGKRFSLDDSDWNGSKKIPDKSPKPHDTPRTSASRGFEAASRGLEAASRGSPMGVYKNTEISPRGSYSKFQGPDRE